MATLEPEMFCIGFCLLFLEFIYFWKFATFIIHELLNHLFKFDPSYIQIYFLTLFM
jgi:hypothetical protein